ncbi:unnamed protein product [Bursaphelenchus okinawaensis]|uniref:Uncharacterized protein n=1 Tax=Bursaphelenchus okinawaensis TaxID=465554 RepID=A0A811KUQ8_9BILA|nr:unnamed protein product [Bursaphelenchus okinawaensis]CAG9111557.1 unnamed protein product [Bursaphelenchus okinawaensis]
MNSVGITVAIPTASSPSSAEVDQPSFSSHFGSQPSSSESFSSQTGTGFNSSSRIFASLPSQPCSQTSIGSQPGTTPGVGLQPGTLASLGNHTVPSFSSQINCYPGTSSQPTGPLSYISQPNNFTNFSSQPSSQLSLSSQPGSLPIFSSLPNSQPIFSSNTTLTTVPSTTPSTSTNQEPSTSAMLFPPEDLTTYMQAMQNNNDLAAFFQHQQQAAAASSLAAAVAACQAQSTSNVAVTSSSVKSQAPPISMPPSMPKPPGFNLAPINDVEMMKFLHNPTLVTPKPVGPLPTPDKPKPKEAARPTASPSQILNGISSSPSHIVNGLKRSQPGTGLQSLQEQLVSSMNGPPPAKRHSISAMPTGPSLPQNGLLMSAPQMNPQFAAAVAAQQMSMNKLNMPPAGMLGMPGMPPFMPNARLNGDAPQPNLLNVPGQMNPMNMQNLQQFLFQQQLMQQQQQQQQAAAAKGQVQPKLSGTAQHHQNIQQQHANWMQAKFLAEQQQQQQRIAQQQQQQRMNGQSPIMNQMQLLQLMQQQQSQQPSQANPLAPNPALLAQHQQLMQLQHQQMLMQQQNQQQQQQTEQRRRAQTIGNASQLSALHQQQIPSITLGQGMAAQPIVPAIPTALTPFGSLTPQPTQAAVSPALSNHNEQMSQAVATTVASSPAEAAAANPPTLQPEQAAQTSQEMLQKILANYPMMDPNFLQQLAQATAAAQNNPQITVTAASEVSNDTVSVANLLAPQSHSVDSAAPTTRAGSTNPSQPDGDSDKNESGLVIAEEEDNPVVD